MSTIQVHIFPIRESQRSHRGQGSGAGDQLRLSSCASSRPPGQWLDHTELPVPPQQCWFMALGHSTYFGMCVMGSAPPMGDWIGLTCGAGALCLGHSVQFALIEAAQTTELFLPIPLQPGILRWALPQPCAQPRHRHSTTCIIGILPVVLLHKRAEPTRRTERAGEEAASSCTPVP